MKNQTYDLISNILVGIFIIILCLLFITTILVPINYAIDDSFRKDCISQNKTYLDVSMVEGIPIKIKYCGDMEQVKQILDNINKIQRV